MIMNLNGLLNQILFNYVTCHYATNATQRVYSITDLVYASKWYMLPVNEQRLLILILNRAQKPPLLQGYGIITCSMASFLRVSSCAGVLLTI